MKKIFKILLFIGIFAFSSCELDYLDSPNDVTLSSSNVDYLLNRVQIDFAAFYSNTQARGARVTRIWHNASDTYEISWQATSQNGVWGNAYANILQDIKSIKTLAEEGGFRRHLGIAKTLEAYVWMVLVDTFGDIPFSEALDPGNFNPAADQGATVYAGALALLQSARDDFAATSIGNPNDYFYGNNATKWVRLINTLELRYHLNRRLIDAAGSTTAINSLISANNFLQTGDDFIFQYGISTADPDSRHPQFAGQFPNGGGDYQSTYFMWHLTEAKKQDPEVPGNSAPSPDPRAHYYFYRQVGENTTNGSEARCVEEFLPAHYPLDMAWCMPGIRGYWGRDHLDPQGIPPDNVKRTLYGLYPAGGSFDNNQPAGMTASNVGNRGAGIQPIMLEAFVYFMLAEAKLTLNTGAVNADVLLQSAIEKHVDFVRNWSLTTLEAPKVTAFISNANHTSLKTAYLDIVDDEYAAAATDTDRMRIIAREYWISLYGNGNEAYNLYRRTGQPDGMQLGQIPNFGKFPRSFFYPTDYVVRNRNAEQKASHDVQVFWDNNPAGFIN